MKPDAKSSSDASTSATRKVVDAIAMGLVNGRSVEEVAMELTRQGWKQEDALALVKKIDEAREQAEKARLARPSLWRNLFMHTIMGLLWIVAGVMLMLTAKPERDLSGLGVAVIAFGIFELVWSLRNLNRMP